MHAAPAKPSSGTDNIQPYCAESDVLGAFIAYSAAFVPLGMLIAPPSRCSKRFRLSRFPTKGERYVVDDSCDSAGSLAAGIYWPRRRWTDSPATRDCVDYFHHQHRLRPKNCLAAALLPSESG
jgi:hypothetical protein